MSKSEQSDFVSIRVSTGGDASTEIFVIDGTFQLAARGVGQLETELKPGLYTVKVQAGSEAKEEDIILFPGDKHRELEIEPLRFTSPAPLAGTANTHEYHEDAVRNQSSQQHVQVGTGSAIFVFIRHWTKPEVETKQRKTHLARGLELRSPNGSTIVDFDDKCTSDNSVPDPWAACNVEVDPGLYILSLELSSGSRLEQTVVASPGWQTQIFLLERMYGPNPEGMRADLPGASIHLSPYPLSFQISDRDKRLSELARIGLAEGRKMLSEEILEMLYGKFQDPMLGIYGAHLLLLEKEPNPELLETVVTNLRSMLDLHPDVEALALTLKNDDSSYVFEIPPMLRRSWTHIIAATITKPEIVPAKSLAAISSAHILGSELWLQWMNPSSQASASQEGSSLATKRKKEFTPVEKSLIAHMAPSQTDITPPPHSESLDALPMFALETPGEATEGTRVPALDEETLAELVPVLGMPRAAIEEMADELSGAA